MPADLNGWMNNKNGNDNEKKIDPPKFEPPKFIQGNNGVGIIIVIAIISLTGFFYLYSKAMDIDNERLKQAYDEKKGGFHKYRLASFSAPHQSPPLAYLILSLYNSFLLYKV